MKLRNIIFISLFLTSYVLQAQNTMIRSGADLYFRDAVELMDKEKYAAARDKFEQYLPLSDNPLKAADAEYYRAFCAIRLFHGDAEGLFLTFIDKYPAHSKVPLAYYYLGSDYYRKENYDKSIEYFEKIDYTGLTEDERMNARFKLGYAYFTKKEFDKALPNFNEVKKAKKDHKYKYAACYYAGYIEFKNEKYEEALQDLNTAESRAEYRSAVAIMKANIYYRMEQYDQLIEYADQLLKNNPNLKDIAEVYLLTGDSYFHKKEYTKAKEYFDKAIGKDAGKASPEVQYRMGYCYYVNGQYEDAANLLKNVASQKDSIGQASSYYLGMSYLKLNNNTYALLPFDNARKMPYNLTLMEESWFNYAKINFELQRYTEATHALKQFLKGFAGSEHEEEASELITECFLVTSNYDEALAYIESLKYGNNIRINAAYQKIAFYKAGQLFNDAQYAEAVRIFEKSIRNPYDKDILMGAYFWQGEANSILKNYHDAAASYNSVFSRDPYAHSPYYLKAHYGIGYAYYNTREYAKATEHFKAYIDAYRTKIVKEHYNDALVRLADLYYVAREYDKALQYYNEALGRDHTEVDYIYFQRGLVYSFKNKTDEAYTNYDMLIRKYPSSVYYNDAVYNRAQLDLQKQNYDKAITGFTSVITNSPNSNSFIPYAYLKRAGAYVSAGKTEEGIQDYKQILVKYPDHEVGHEALLGLQQAMEHQGRSEEFSDILNQYRQGSPTTNTAQVEYNNAYSFYSSQKYQKAIDAFKNFIKNYPLHQKIKDAQYYLAESYYKQKDFENALVEYKKVLEDRTYVNYNRCLLRVADLELEQNHYEIAKKNYLLLISSANNKKDKFTAWSKLIEVYYVLEKYDSVHYYAKEMLAVGNLLPESGNKANLYIAKAYFKQNNYDKATDFCLEVVNNSKDAYGAEAQYILGDILYMQQKYKPSIEAFYQVNNAYSKYEPWVSKAFYMIAENFVALGETFQAKTTLKSIIDNSGELETVEKSRKRLEELEAAEKGGQKQ